MLDVGWSELLVIAVVLIVVVGPKDLPPMLRAFGKMTARMRAMAGEFRAQFDEALREAELDDVRKTIGDAQRLNPVNTLREAINPLRQTANEIRADLQGAVSSPAAAAPAAATAAEPAVSPAAEPAVSPAPVAAEASVTLPPIDAQPSVPADLTPPGAPAATEHAATEAAKKDGA